VSTADPLSARPEIAVPLISIVVVTYGTGPVVIEMLEALGRHTAVAHEVIVVDNPVSGEGRPTVELLRERDDIIVVETQSNLGFAGGNELGVRHAHGEYLCFLNPDVIVGPGWIEPLIDALADPVVGVAAPVLRDPDGSLQEAGQLLYADACTAAIGGPEILTGDEAQVFSRDVDYASAACWVVRRDEHIARGGFDLRYHPAFFEDVDYALRVEREGKRTRLVADVPVVHHHGQGGAGKSLKLGQASQEVFRSIWSDRLGEQPARPVTAADAVRSRDRLAEQTTVFSTQSDESANKDRRGTFDDAVALAASRPRERVTFLAGDSTGLDLARARSAGLEVVIAESPSGVDQHVADDSGEIRSPAPSPGRRYGFIAALALVAIVGLITRVLVLRSPAARLGSDEAYTGIQAFEILGGDFPVVLGGTVYTLPFESYLYAPIQAVFGAHIVALKFLSTLAWAGATVVIFLIGRAIRGTRMGAIAAALLWLAPGAMLLLSVTSYASYSSGMLVTLIAFLLALRILDAEDPSRGSMALFGASAGFACWLHPMFLATLIPMVVVVLAAERKRLDAWWSVILGGLAGCSPLLLWNALNGWPSLEAPVQVEGTYAERLSTFVRDLFPRTFGLRDGALQWQPGEVFARLLYVLLIAGVVYGVVVVTRRPGRRAGRFLLPAVLIAVLPIMALFQNLIFALDGRYGVIAFPFLVVALAAGIDELAGREIGLRTLGVFGVIGLVWLGALTGPTLRTLVDTTDGDPNVTAQAILDRLEDVGITEIYGSYWSVLPVEFLADDEITAGVVARWPVRFPERQRVVEATPPEEVAFLFQIADEDPTSLWLPVAEYERDVIGDNVLYIPTIAAAD
jgi:GT2 family glycosyltransferase